MRLVRMTLNDFRCYHQPITIDFDAITALIGKNDAGKSALLDALDIFFNDNMPDKDDGSKHGTPSNMAIACEFDDLPDKVVIDNAHLTDLKAEGLLNSNNRLEIHKQYSGNNASPSLKGVYAQALHPTIDNASDLLQLKNADLKERANEMGVDITEIDTRINAKIRAEIREHIGDLKPELTLVALNMKDANNTWLALKSHLPMFALFRSDRKSSDQDSEAQEPLKTAVKEALKSKEPELQAIATYVETEVALMAEKTLEKLKEMDASLATELKPQFKSLNWDGIFKANFIDNNDIPVNKRGSGVRRLVLLNFFRAKAEKIASEAGEGDLIYAIEEPETSQHPNNQRMLLNALNELSEDSQIIFSSHTPMLVRALPDSALRYIRVNDDNSRSVLVGGDETNDFFARALGVLPDNNVKLFIGVEGPNDISFLQHVSKALRAGGEDILDLEQLERDGEVIFFPLGGSTLVLWTTRLTDLNRPEFHIYDRDYEPPKAPKYQEQVDEINLRDRCKAMSTSKMEMENYLHWEAIKEAYHSIGLTLPINTNFNDFDNVPVLIAKKVHNISSTTEWTDLDSKLRKKKEQSAKRILNQTASRNMTKARLDEIDPNGDVLAWLNDMADMMQC